MRKTPRSFITMTALLMLPFSLCLAGEGEDIMPNDPDDGRQVAEPFWNVATSPEISAGDLPLRIDQPGLYRLVENVSTASRGIAINADGVTIDLMGHTLRGGQGNGIGRWYPINTRPSELERPLRGLVVKNGTVSNWGRYGVNLKGAADSQLVNLLAAENDKGGILAGSGMIRDCVVHANGGDGLRVAGAMVSGCSAFGNAGAGIVATDGSMLRHSTSRENSGSGIEANASTVEQCVAHRNDGDGIFAQSDSALIANQSSANGQVGAASAGIRVVGSGNHIERNRVTGNPEGVVVTGTGNLIFANSASGNAVPFMFGPANDHGGVGNASGSDNTFVNIEF